MHCDVVVISNLQQPNHITSILKLCSQCKPALIAWGCDLCDGCEKSVFLLAPSRTYAFYIGHFRHLAVCADFGLGLGRAARRRLWIYDHWLSSGCGSLCRPRRHTASLILGCSSLCRPRHDTARRLILGCSVDHHLDDLRLAQCGALDFYLRENGDDHRSPSFQVIGLAQQDCVSQHTSPAKAMLPMLLPLEALSFQS